MELLLGCIPARPFLVAACLWWVLAPAAAGQSPLRLDTVTAPGVHPVIEVRMSGSVMDQLLDSRGAKIEVTNVPFRFDDREALAESFRIRGRSSTNYMRKSFTVELDTAMAIPFDRDTLALRKFYLVSMNMDHHYFHNKLSFACLSQLGLFNLRQRYVEVRINRRSQGVYLLIQRPEDHLFDELNSAYFLRRGYKNRIEEDEFEGSFSEAFKDSCRQRFHQIYEAVDSLNGQALYTYLNERLNLRDYMRWMAFNYWFKNGDYSDEVFFYLPGKRADLPYEILAWDYDDIFADAPHEGPMARRQWLGDAMIFSAESILDRTIGQDEYLYRHYLEELRYVLSALPEEWLAKTCNDIYRQLYPFYQDKAILRVSRYDRGGSTSLKSLREALMNVYDDYLVQRRRELYQTLQAALR